MDHRHLGRAAALPLPHREQAATHCGIGVHTVNSYLFGLTALGALLHLAIHTLWLSLITMFFPALGASCTRAGANPKPIGSAPRPNAWWSSCKARCCAFRTALDEEAATNDVAALQGVDRGGNRANTRGASGLASAGRRTICRLLECIRGIERHEFAHHAVGPAEAVLQRISPPPRSPVA